MDDRSPSRRQRRRRQAQGRRQDRAHSRIKVVAAETLKKPEWIRVRAAVSPRFYEIKQILREHNLHTVCEEASCPNIGECFGKGTATFMIMGDICTRRCPFCDVGHGRPLPLDADEPANLAQDDRRAAPQVRRDHERRSRRPARRRRAALRRLHPRGARALARARRSRCWCPIFAAASSARSTSSSAAPPDVMNHNLEIGAAAVQAGAPRLGLRAFAALLREFKRRVPGVPTKSGLMVGLGETDDEILADDARHARARHRHADARPVPAAVDRSSARAALRASGRASRRSSAKRMRWASGMPPSARWCARRITPTSRRKAWSSRSVELRGGDVKAWRSGAACARDARGVARVDGNAADACGAARRYRALYRKAAADREVDRRHPHAAAVADGGRRELRRPVDAGRRRSRLCARSNAERAPVRSSRRARRGDA